MALGTCGLECACAHSFNVNFSHFPLCCFKVLPITSGWECKPGFSRKASGWLLQANRVLSGTGREPRVGAGSMGAAAG